MTASELSNGNTNSGKNSQKYMETATIAKMRSCLLAADLSKVSFLSVLNSWVCISAWGKMNSGS